MRVLVYKRTHNGDPEEDGCFGASDCMGRVRARDFDAVICVGGLGSKATKSGIAGKVNWIGVGPHKRFVRDKRGPEVTFDRFVDLGSGGPDLHRVAPNLAKHIYSRNVRAQIHDERSRHYREVIDILVAARGAKPPSGRSKAWGCKRSVPRCARRLPT